MSHNIIVESGTSVRLPTSGKYCDRDIMITATGGTEDLDAVLTEQETLIATLQETLREKAVGGGAVNTPTQEKSVEITSNETVEVLPDDGYTLSKVTVSVDVPSELNAMLTDTLTSINSNISTVCGYACYARAKIKTVNLPNATKLGTNAFRACTQLIQFDAPNAVTLESYLFYVCSKLPSVNFPVATNIPNYCFGTCAAFVKADFGSVTSINASAFASSSKFETLILRSTTMATLANVNAFSGTKIASGTGYIYVPKSLVDSYKGATNWLTYEAQFRAIEDYPDICGGEV